uniref:Kinesin motor domain-containing protein n=1 Tax=Globodera rostochiensis TaxID=31243 RepID=A0A914HXT9_GLORO
MEAQIYLKRLSNQRTKKFDMTQLGNGISTVSHRHNNSLAKASKTTALSSDTSMASSSNAGECVKVAVRCRPLSSTEISQGHSNIVRADVSRGCIEVQNPKEPNQPLKCFLYDSIFGENSKQLDLYDETVRAIVDSVLQGFNGTVFAYGQTGTGKTHTMEGEGRREDPAQRGVIPNAIEHIFQHIAHSPPNQQYLVRASFLEIYQEEIRDLLNRNANKRLELKERPDVGVYVKELSSFVTKSVEEIEHVIKVGRSNRSVGRTNMNEHSSRSHAIFVITVECSETDQDGQTHIRVGRLNLVDLAGSERQSKTGSEGQRFREATRINLSLSALGNVISALSDQSSAHIPYRDSKLTRLLQDSLGGNSKTVMIANIGPASYNFEETLSTLRYASRAKQIENKPKINEDPKDALLREFQDEIARLKELLEQRRRTPAAATASAPHKSRRKTEVELAEEGKENNIDVGTEAEAYAREQQLRLEKERERLLQNGALIEEERQRILTELEGRERELERERQEQLAVAAKIRAMQSKLLSGDGNLLDRTRRQEEQLRQRRSELMEQRRRERELAQKLESQELEAAEIRQTFANLQQEVEAKRRKMHKLHAKLQSLRLDLQDLEDANAAERHGLEQTVLEMNKELALKWLIIDNFIPSTVAEFVRKQAQFDEVEQQWRLRGGGQAGTSSSTFSTDEASGGRPIERLNLALSPNPPSAMADSGLGSSNGGSHGPSATEEDDTATSKVPQELKRPMAFAGARRPISAFELSSLTKLRQRLARQGPKNGEQRLPNLPESLPELTIPEEVLRFGCENLLTFQSLLTFPSEVRFTTAADASSRASSVADQQRVVLDASRIPVLTHRRTSHGASRPGSASGTRRNSTARSAIIYPQQHSQIYQQTSKNARARSVFSSASERMNLASERTAHSKSTRDENGVREGSVVRAESNSLLKRVVGGGAGGGQIPISFPNARGGTETGEPQQNAGEETGEPQQNAGEETGEPQQNAGEPQQNAGETGAWRWSNNGDGTVWERSRHQSPAGSLQKVRTASPLAMRPIASKIAGGNFCSASAFLTSMAANSMKPHKKSRIPVLITSKTLNNLPAKRSNGGDCLEMVPYFQLQSQSSDWTFREQLSSPTEGDGQSEYFLRHISRSFWSPALSRANFTLTKAQKGQKNCARFHTLPAVLNPILKMPRGTSLCHSPAMSVSSSGGAISHCCLCSSSSSCWLKMPKKSERQLRIFGRVQKGRVHKKRRKNGTLTTFARRIQNCASREATNAGLDSTLAASPEATNAGLDSTLAASPEATNAGLDSTLAASPEATNAGLDSTLAASPEATNAGLDSTLAASSEATNAGLDSTLAASPEATNAGLDSTLAASPEATNAGLDSTLAASPEATNAGLDSTLAASSEATNAGLDSTSALLEWAILFAAFALLVRLLHALLFSAIWSVRVFSGF